MKYLRLTLAPIDRVIHPVDRFLDDLDGVEREHIRHVDSRPGEVMVLYDVSGDRELIHTALDDHHLVNQVELVESGDHLSLFVRLTTDEEGGFLVSAAHQHALIIETPIEVTPQGVDVTLVGTHDDLRKALEEFSETIDVTVLEAGSYAPSEQGLLEPLTDRQLEVFQMAVDRGYYELPRRTTHKDLAGELDCAPSTVDEHLRKAEARVVSRLVG